VCSYDELKIQINMYDKKLFFENYGEQLIYNNGRVVSKQLYPDSA